MCIIDLLSEQREWNLGYMVACTFCPASKFSTLLVDQSGFRCFPFIIMESIKILLHIEQLKEIHDIEILLKSFVLNKNVGMQSNYINWRLPKP
ncbi:hypothetical protein AW736_12605 [Termitidicoccus mucosus]|uniref:Uncharacterized protein n=1 Tax=Termitidicoccus mucosus TaxID=1184151 RepID=A0A178IJQ7_9BACT|nr:hypothetical protein AW736_12605 [Opitutaceae bacterium TSB47]